MGRRRTGAGGGGEGRPRWEKAAGRRWPDLGCGGDEAATVEETGAVDEVGRGGRRRRRWRGDGEGPPGRTRSEAGAEEGRRAGVRSRPAPTNQFSKYVVKSFKSKKIVKSIKKF